MKKIYSIELIRALVCVCVCVCHFKGAFIPHSAIVQKLMQTPVAFLFLGNVPVRLLFVISGLVLSLKYLQKDYRDVFFCEVVKRYVRLGFPCLVTILIAYVLMSAKLYFNVQAAALTDSQDFLGVFNNFSPNLLLALKEGLYRTLLLKGNAYVGPMWTMTYEFFGSILVMVICMLFYNKIQYRIIIYTICFFCIKGYYPYFILGMMVSDFYLNSSYKDNWTKKKEIVCSVVMITSFLYLCNPKYVDANTFNYIVFSVSCLLFFESLLHCRWINAFSEKFSFGLWLGKNSFAVYLLHWPVIETVSCAMFLKLYGCVDKKILVLLVLGFSLSFILLVADLFNRTVEMVANRIGERMKNGFVFRKKLEVRI